MKLNDINIKKAKPGDKTRKLSDGGGLYLQIATTGGKLWRFDYRFEGKRKTLAIGKYPDVSLQDAREKHQEARKLLAQGIDPAAAKKAHKAAGVERAANSFEVVARQWHERWKNDVNEKYAIRSLTILEKNVFPYLGNKPVSEIKTPDILAVLQRIEDRGRYSVARMAKDLISMAYRYAVQTGRAEYNPCDNLRGALKSPRTKKNFAAFTKPDDFAELLRAIDGYKSRGAVVRAALRLLPLVFCRPGELRNMKWADIDFDAAQWCYLSTKKKKQVIVPLARQAVEMLKDLHPLTSNGEYVFPGTYCKRPISEMALNFALRYLGYDTKTEHTPHGFRASARTMLRERLKFDPEIIEFQLSHETKNPLGNAYDRALFIDDRRHMMQAWADYCDRLKAGESANVIPFERATA